MGASEHGPLIAIAFVLLLLVLVATSSPRSVGDGDEYLRVSERVAHLQRPGGVSRHFWLYPALAAPFVRAAEGVGLNPLWGFTVLNVLMLSAAFAVVRTRVGSIGTVLIMVGPVLWWLDKPHTEPFTFALLAVGFALLRTAPWWTFVTVAIAATHNLPIALALPIAGLAAVWMHPAWLRDRRFWAGTAAAGLVLGVALGYNWLHAGKLAPLLDRDHLQWPSLAELGAPVWDPNLGLLPNFPGLTLVVAALVVVLMIKAPGSLIAPEVIAGALAAAAFVFGAAQATNVNHGGTPGLSRYAVWLIPTAIPLLMRVRGALPSAQRWLWPVTIGSAAACLLLYNPHATEQSGRATRLAQWLWTQHPSLDNPLPEVFVERVTRLDEDWVPVATAGCEKILTSGRGTGRPIWPMPCPPAQPPATCLEAGRLCYANRSPTGYRFVVLPPRGDRFRVRREDIWSPGAEEAAKPLFVPLDWRAMQRATTIETSSDVERVAGLQTPRGVIVILRGIGPSASLVLRLDEASSAKFIRADTGEAVADVQVARGLSQLAIPHQQGSPSLILLLKPL